MKSKSQSPHQSLREAVNKADVSLAGHWSGCHSLPLSVLGSRAGHPFDQWMRHLPPLPAAGAARDPDPLLQQRPLQWIPCSLLLILGTVLLSLLL